MRNGTVLFLVSARNRFRCVQKQNTFPRLTSLFPVFLRALEYYRGLLFLTTNRVNTFDEAFKSRIHVSLYYKKLGNEERLKIWANSFKRLEEAGVHVTGTAKQYAFTDPDVLNLELNGREIRNGRVIVHTVFRPMLS